MKKEKIKKTVKVISIVLAAVLIVFAAVSVIIFNFVIKPNSQGIINAVDEIMQDEDILKMIEPYIQPDLPSDGNGDNSVVTQNDGESAPVVEAAGGDAAENKNNSGMNKPKKKRSEYSSQYDYVRDNVSESDFARGVSLASKVDVGYILGLLSGGLTNAEKAELKTYLTSRLTGSEIADGIALYSKYSYLLK